MENKIKTTNKYSEDFKKSIVTLLENGKSFSYIEREYGVSYSAARKWKKLFSSVTTVDGEIITAKQIKELQKRNAQLEEDNIILKKCGSPISLSIKQKVDIVLNLKSEHNISTICRVINLNKRTYYKYINKSLSKKELFN